MITYLLKLHIRLYEPARTHFLKAGRNVILQSLSLTCRMIDTVKLLYIHKHFHIPKLTISLYKSDI